MAIVSIGHPMSVKGAPGEVHDSAQNPLGLETWFYDNTNNVTKKYVYLQGVASTVTGAWVSYDEAGLTTGIDTDVAASCTAPVAIATAAVVANKYGWYGRTGSFTALVAASFADNGLLYATSTVFVADDAAVANMQIIGAVGRSAISGSSATVQINDPWIGVDEAAA